MHPRSKDLPSGAPRRHSLSTLALRAFSVCGFSLCSLTGCAGAGPGGEGTCTFELQACSDECSAVEAESAALGAEDSAASECFTECDGMAERCDTEAASPSEGITQKSEPGSSARNGAVSRSDRTSGRREFGDRGGDFWAPFDFSWP